MKKALKFILPVVVLMFGLAAAGILILLKKQVTMQPTLNLATLVETALVQPTHYQFRLETQGTVRPRTEIQLIPEISGRVIDMSSSMEEGGFFEKDEVLIRIDPRDFELALTRAQSQVADARYRLVFEQAEAAVARQEWESLGGEGEPNPLLLREPQAAQAQANLASAEAVLEQAQRDLERCYIKAPFAGRVGQKSIDIGQYIAKGVSVGRLFAVDYAEIRLPLTPNELAFVDLPLDYRGEKRSETGPEVHFKAQVAGQEHVWVGYIDRTEGEIDIRTRMLFAVARVKNPYGRGENQDRPPLAMGLFVQAEIMGRQANNVVVLPRTAMRGKDQVLVVDKDNTVHFRKVTVLRAIRNKVIIKAGLEAGEEVCTTPLDIVSQGMKVRTEASLTSKVSPADAPIEEEDDE